MSDKRLVTVLNALVKPTRRKELKPLEPRGALPGKRSFAEYTPTPSRTGGGIASPLVEPSYAAREFWGDRYFTTSDGFFALQLQPVKKIVMQDANGEPVVQQFAEPV